MANRSTQVVFVTVGWFSNPLFAWMLRNKLVDEGLDAFVQDDFVATMNWLYTTAIGGIKVQVPYEQLHQAKEVISRDYSQVFSSLPRTTTDAELPRCSSCGSSEIHEEQVAVRLFFLVWMVIGLPFPFISSAIECYDCGHRDGPPTTYTFRQYSLRHLFLLTFIIGCTLGLMRLCGYSWFQHAATPNYELPIPIDH